MRRLLLALLLTACAPAATRTAAPTFQASFSAGGVLWAEGDRVTLARAPSFRPQAVPVPAGVTALGWQTANGLSTPWVGLGRLGLLFTADARPLSVPVGRVVAMSAGRVYREDGSAVNFDGTPAGRGLLGRPDAVMTGGDAADYAVQAGQLYRLHEGGQTTLGPARPYLYADAGGAGTANVPTVVTPTGRYQLTGTALERRDAAGALLSAVPHPAGLLGAVGTMIVTVQPGGTLRVFSPELNEVQP